MRRGGGRTDGIGVSRVDRRDTGFPAHPISKLCALCDDDWHPSVFLALEAIIALAEDQIPHDIVGQPIAPLAHISRNTPSFVATP